MLRGAARYEGSTGEGEGGKDCNFLLLQLERCGRISQEQTVDLPNGHFHLFRDHRFSRERMVPSDLFGVFGNFFAKFQKS